MCLKQMFLGMTAFCFGMIVSGGVFTVFVTVGLIPRFAGKTHTGKHVTIYESMVNLGAIGGCLFSVFCTMCQLGPWILKNQIMTRDMWKLIAEFLLLVFGFFAGMFEGCFAIAIAEMLNTIPIFSRRIGFRHGLGIAILMIALGKIAGSLFYFANQIYLYGGS